MNPCVEVSPPGPHSITITPVTAPLPPPPPLKACPAAVKAGKVQNGGRSALHFLCHISTNDE